MPIATGRMPSRRTIRLMSCAAAPIAIRTPISLVRWLTECAITAHEADGGQQQGNHGEDRRHLRVLPQLAVLGIHEVAVEREAGLQGARSSPACTSVIDAPAPRFERLAATLARRHGRAHEEVRAPTAPAPAGTGT